MTAEHARNEAETGWFLVLEDEPGDAGLIRAALCDLFEDCEIEVIRRSDEMLARLGQILREDRDNFPRAAILDLRVPPFSGMEVLAFLQGNLKLSRIPTIILSGTADETIAATCAELGARKILQKPGSFAKLKASIETALAELIERDERT